MSQPVVFGIPNCDTVRKARQWLDKQSIEHDFVDLRADTPPANQIIKWLAVIGSDRLINRRSSTFKCLTQFEKEILSSSDAVNVLLAKPTLIKRPVLEWNSAVSVGFKAEDYARLFGT